MSASQRFGSSAAGAVAVVLCACPSAAQLCGDCPRDPCERVRVAADQECVKCEGWGDDSCVQNAAADGFKQLCKPFYGETRWCRTERCTAATLDKLDRGRCRLVTILHASDDAVVYPMHDEVCRSYRNPDFAIKKRLGRKILCLKPGVPAPLPANPSADEVAKDCVKGVEEDCGRRCVLGNARSCMTLGEMYAEGFGVGRDLDKATSSYARSCELGHKDGCLQGALHEWRIGESERNAPAPDRTWDGHRAAWLFERACFAGAIEACQTLAAMHCQGVGLPADCSAADAVVVKLRAAGLAAADCAHCPQAASKDAPTRPKPAQPPSVTPLGRLSPGSVSGCGSCAAGSAEKHVAPAAGTALLLLYLGMIVRRSRRFRD